MSMSKRPQHRIVKRSTGRRSTKSPPARIPTHIIKQFQQQDRQRQGVRQSFEQSQQTISSQLEFLQAQVHSWRDRCWYCTQKRFTAAHDLYQCPHGNRTAAKAWFLHVRRHIQYAPFSGCFQCGLPQVICRQWQHQGQCAYRGVMISMIAMMVHGDGTEAVRQAWQRRLDGFGVDAEDRTAVVGFLGRRHGAEEVNELVQEFVWLRKTWMEVGEIGWVGLDIVVVSRDRITRIVIRILLQLNEGYDYDWMWDINMIEYGISIWSLSRIWLWELLFGYHYDWVFRKSSWCSGYQYDAQTLLGILWWLWMCYDSWILLGISLQGLLFGHCYKRMVGISI